MNATQSTPAGCFIGALAVVPLMASVVAGYGFYQWCHLPVKSRHVDENFWVLVSVLVCGVLLALALAVIARRVLRSTDFRGYDSRDPSESNLKW